MSEEEGEMEDPSSTLQEPFLSSPSAAQTLPEDSIRSTLSKYVSLAAVASGEEADSVESESDRERDLQIVSVGILGKPYADNTNFWCKLFPLSLLAGALMGVTTLLYQGSLKVLFHLWHPDAQTQHDSGEWKWLFLTSFGALGSALILLFPKAPNPGSVRNLFHDVNDLKGIAHQTPYVALSCFVCLATGAPLGPEMALGALGSGLAGLFQSCIRIDRRSEAALVLTGMTGSVAGLLPSPVLAVLLFHELSITGRPFDFTLDSLVATETYVPGSSLQDHDYMEQITLCGAAATVAYVATQLLIPPSLYPWKDPYPLEGSFAPWHLAVAIPLGLVCGKVGSLALILKSLFGQVRVKTCAWLQEQAKCPAWLSMLIFPTLAGVLHGLLAVANPFLAGTGTSVALRFVQQQEEQHFGKLWLLGTALLKVVSMSMCLGFGLTGGPLFPLGFAGICIGIAMSTSMFPLCLTVPCCICATVGSVVPIPFTLVWLVASIFDLPPQQMGPPLVSAFVAFTFTGGTGVLKRLGEKRLGVVVPDPRTHNRDESDDDILASIRSAVFGSYSEL